MNKRFILNLILTCCCLCLTIQANAQTEAPTAEDYFNRAEELLEQGDLESAILNYTKAIELKPDYSVAYEFRALFYISNGNFDEAINDATKDIF